MNESYRIIMLPEASGDLERLHEYISQDSPDRAADMVATILDAIASLRSFPERYALVRLPVRTKHPSRFMTVNPFIIYYRVIEAERTVLIQTIRHAARRPPRYLR